jgi:hypothetical protein
MLLLKLSADETNIYMASVASTILWPYEEGKKHKPIYY